MSLCWIVNAISKDREINAWRAWNAWAAAAVALAISLVSTLMWTSWRPDWLPWYLESYVNGVHNLGVPQPWIFPIFPWVALAFAGLAVGFLLLRDNARAHEVRTAVWFGIAGAALAGLALVAASYGWPAYFARDFWHTSPDFFLFRVGLLLVILLAAYVWCRWGPPAQNVQPAGTTRADVIARVLGPHRICLRAAFDSAQASFNGS